MDISRKTEARSVYRLLLEWMLQCNARYTISSIVRVSLSCRSMYQAIPSCSLLSIYGFLPKCRSVKYLLLDITQEEVWKQNIIAHRESVDIF